MALEREKDLTSFVWSHVSTCHGYMLQVQLNGTSAVAGQQLPFFLALVDGTCSYAKSSVFGVLGGQGRMVKPYCVLCEQ